jgi:hypothetical protein
VKPLETLRALGTGGEAPAEAKQRVHSALMASLGAAVAASTAAGVAQSATLLSAPTPAPLIAGLTSAKALLVAGGIWLIGGATGAALYGALHPQEVRVVYVDRPVLPNSVAAPLTAPTATATATPTATAASLALAPAVDLRSKRAAPASAGAGSELSSERALLDLARADAARGEPALVLSQTEQHRTQFPRGRLAEEREALAIRALHSLGRTDEARARAQAFQLAYPHSFLLPAIDSALSAP